MSPSTVKSKQRSRIQRRHKYFWHILIIPFLFFLMLPCGVHAWMFHANPQHSGIFDDGGTRPDNVQKWNYTTLGWVTSSPAVVNGVVYVGQEGQGSGNGMVYALNARNGSKLWNFTTGGSVGASPAVVNNVVYINSLTRLYAINAVTGKELWNTSNGGSDDSSPAVVNGTVYVGGNSYAVHAFNAETGAFKWSSPPGTGLAQVPRWQTVSFILGVMTIMCTLSTPRLV